VAKSASNRFTESDVNTDPNVVPMIDVMLVLLVIFMIVTPIITTGFKATMPESLNPEARPEENEDIILGIDQGGDFYLQIGSEEGKGGSRLIPEDSLPVVLARIYSARTKDKILFLKADKEIKFGRVQDAVEIARQSGVRVLGAITDKRQELFAHRGEN